MHRAGSHRVVPGVVPTPGIPFGPPCLKLAHAHEFREPEATGQRRQDVCVWFGPVPRPPAQSPAGADSMSDWFAEVAHHATPSGGAIVDHTKDESEQGRGRDPGQRSGQRSGVEGCLVSRCTLPPEPALCPATVETFHVSYYFLTEGEEVRGDLPSPECPSRIL